MGLRMIMPVDVGSHRILRQQLGDLFEAHPDQPYVQVHSISKSSLKSGVDDRSAYAYALQGRQPADKQDSRMMKEAPSPISRLIWHVGGELQHKNG